MVFVKIRCKGTKNFLYMQGKSEINFFCLVNDAKRQNFCEIWNISRFKNGYFTL